MYSDAELLNDINVLIQARKAGDKTRAVKAMLRLVRKLPLSI